MIDKKIKSIYKIGDVVIAKKISRHLGAFLHEKVERNLKNQILSFGDKHQRVPENLPFLVLDTAMFLERIDPFFDIPSVRFYLNLYHPKFKETFWGYEFHFDSLEEHE